MREIAQAQGGVVVVDDAPKGTRIVLRSFTGGPGSRRGTATAARAERLAQRLAGLEVELPVSIICRPASNSGAQGLHRGGVDVIRSWAARGGPGPGGG